MKRYSRHRLVVAVAAAGLVILALLPPAATGAGPEGRSQAVKVQAKDHPLKELWSGYRFAGEEARSLQDDDAANPAMTLYRDGESAWSSVDGKGGKSCSTCHGIASKSMRSVGVRFPVYYALAKRPITVEERINVCREKFMQAKPLASDSNELLALTVYVKGQARKASTRPHIDGSTKEFFEKGKAYYTTRRGQLNLACRHCHDAHAGRNLGGQLLSQGHANGYPAYRLSWGATGSLLRQVNDCLTRLRAKPLAFGSEALANLELYLTWRGQGLFVETPSVRD